MTEPFEPPFAYEKDPAGKAEFYVRRIKDAELLATCSDEKVASYITSTINLVALFGQASNALLD